MLAGKVCGPPLKVPECCLHAVDAFSTATGDREHVCNVVDTQIYSPRFTPTTQGLDWYPSVIGFTLSVHGAGNHPVWHLALTASIRISPCSLLLLLQLCLVLAILPELHHSAVPLALLLSPLVWASRDWLSSLICSFTYLVTLSIAASDT